MKRYLRFNKEDKKFVKMINQSEKGFELVVLSDEILHELLEMINTCEEQGDEINIVWQTKFKESNYVLYKNCVFSSPMDNIFKRPKSDGYRISTETISGKKIKISCESSTLYTNDQTQNQFIYGSGTKPWVKDGPKFKNATLLERMMKITELNLKNENK